jgi:ADP-ribose pyrophosphatase YjhB (NUDIX family)
VVREWLVAAGLIEGPEGLVLVQNRRRDGSLDWTPPGGVIEVHEGETVRDGLTREVAEETGLLVTDWEGPVYRVEVIAEGLGWLLQVEAYRAREFAGELAIADPDGIVVDARFVSSAAWEDHLAGAHRWVREPVIAFLGGGSAPLFRYRLDGVPGVVEVVRLPVDA